jgi:hypothetical protein
MLTVNNATSWACSTNRVCASLIHLYSPNTFSSGVQPVLPMQVYEIQADGDNYRNDLSWGPMQWLQATFLCLLSALTLQGIHHCFAKPQTEFKAVNKDSQGELHSNLQNTRSDFVISC